MNKFQFSVIALLVAVVLLAGLACGSSYRVNGPGPGVSSLSPSHACGLERWSVKTGTDPDARKVDLSSITKARIVDLNALRAPSDPPNNGRVSPVETTVYQVQAILTGFKEEADSDYHLILRDGSATMIAEIPDPSCIGASSPFLVDITSARNEFIKQFQ